MNDNTNNLLPTIALGPHRVTRLIIGGNPLRGYSHFSEALDGEMREWHTTEQTVATWHEAERQGLNALVARSDAIIFAALDRYREEGGGLQWIAQNAPEWPAGWEDNLEETLRRKPIAVYHHGTRTDNYYKEDRLEEALPFLRAVRESGVQVGLSTHMPEVVRYVEEAGWDVDFYMACLYNLSRIQRESLLAGGERVEEPFDDADREVMLATVRQVSKPCLVFKLLGANRHGDTPERVRAAFELAYGGMKPGDAAVVGMWQKHENQAAANAQLVREIVGQSCQG